MGVGRKRFPSTIGSKRFALNNLIGKKRFGFSGRRE